MNKHALLVLVPALAAAPAAAQAAGQTLAFAVYDWANALYQTRFVDECPEGLGISNDEYWWRGLSKQDRARLTNNGLLEAGNRHNVAKKRGPNGEDVCLDPTVISDPPMRVVEGKYSFGENVDSNEDGRATAKTCAHGNFTSLDGVPGIDNQMYRLIGCTYGWRTLGGLIDQHANEMRRASGLGMTLIEITGVKDPRNSPDVTVTFYRSIDQFMLDGKSKPLPHVTYRIDLADGKPRYGDSLKGGIKDGVLTTERGDVRMAYTGNYSFINPVIRDMGLKLELAPDSQSAKGMITGYFDAELFAHYANGLGGTIPVSYFSCSALHQAALRLADGYPDPKTGQCTALSSAFNILAAAAFILKPAQQSAEAP